MTDRQKNILLAVTSTLLCYLFLELVVWRPNLNKVPLAMRQQLGFLDILAQPSKAGTLPRPGYVAIIGDSYAEGLGDWLMQVIHDGNPDINAGDILYRISGRDVLSFGTRGGYPAQTFTFEVTAAVEGINRYAGLELPEAGDVVAYFYEGNDTNDLIAALRDFRPEWAKGQDMASPDIARRLVDAWAQDGYKRAHRRWTVFGNAHLADTGGHLAKLAYKNVVRRTGRLLAGEDPMFSGLWTYNENWGRHQQSQHFVYAGGKAVPYPSPTVEPFVFHDDREIRTSALYLSESLRHLRTVFPKARLWVAYIPSPINVYPLAQPTIAIQDRIREPGNEHPGPVTEIPGSAMIKVSNASCAAMQAAAREQGMEFIDTRPGFREASAALGYLHGPNDPGHLNRKGYETLAAMLKTALDSRHGVTCADLQP